MRKKVLAIIVFSLLLINFSYYNQQFFDGNATYVLNGKSSGEISKNYKDWAFNDGVCYKFQNGYDYLSLIDEKNAELVKIEKVEGVINYYYYSPTIAVKEVVNKASVNVHVAVSDSGVSIGIPFIYCDY